MSTRTLFDRRMGWAALVVSGGILLSRVLGQLREIIFAGLLGANAATDQYVAAFVVPDFLNYLLAGGFLSITFIPIFSKYLADGDEAGGWEAFTAVLRPITIGITVFVVAGWFAARPVIDAIFPNFTAEQVDTTVRLTRIVLPAQVFFVVGALLTAVQYAKGRFVIPTLAPIIYNLGIIVGGIAFAWAGEADPEGFIWGALVGAFVGNFALQLMGAGRAGLRITWSLEWRHPAIRQYLVIALPLMLGQSIVVLDETFMRTFGNLVAEGTATQLQYARRTMLVPVGLIAQAAGVAAYPYLARLFAEGRLPAMKSTVDRAIRYVLVLSLAAAGLLMALTVPVITALFERSAFTDADTAASARALFFYALSIPIWGALQLLTRAFYAKRDMWTPVIVGTAATVLALPLYLGLQRGFGLRGVALASTLSLGLYTVALGGLWYRSARDRARLRSVLDSAGRAVPPVVAGSLAAFAVGEIVAAWLGTGFFAALVTVVAGTAAFGAAAAGMIAALYRFTTGGPTPVRAEREGATRSGGSRKHRDEDQPGG